MEPAEWRSVLLRNRPLLLAIATAMSAVAALVSSVPLPRGPVTGEQGLIVMASLVVVSRPLRRALPLGLALAPIAYIAPMSLPASTSGAPVSRRSASTRSTASQPC